MHHVWQRVISEGDRIHLVLDAEQAKKAVVANLGSRVERPRHRG